MFNRKIKKSIHSSRFIYQNWNQTSGQGEDEDTKDNELESVYNDSVHAILPTESRNLMIYDKKARIRKENKRRTLVQTTLHDSSVNEQVTAAITERGFGKDLSPDRPTLEHSHEARVFMGLCFHARQSSCSSNRKLRF